MKERQIFKVNGFIVLLVLILLGIFVAFSIYHQQTLQAVIALLVWIVIATGIFTLQPNKAVAVVFFGQYLGTVRSSGFWWSVPFAVRRGISLRVRNFTSEILKVNDINGNPIEIAAVVVYRVVDSAKALFDVENYEKFVQIQSEAALRHIASNYPYDAFEHDQHSLRGNAAEISEELAKELQERLTVAGVEVVEARFTHLAYATEIAGAMLQRQQAAAIVAARSLIVEGAVGMVKMAIRSLEEENIIELDEERKANMVNNLMVAITSERSAQPVINTGTLY